MDLFNFGRADVIALHKTWIAFFITFYVWFNMAPLATTIMKETGLTLDQLKILAICNVALTVHGARFLPHARTVLTSADTAIAAVRELQVLRVAVHGAQIVDGNLMRFYLERHPDAQIELFMMGPSKTSRDAVVAGRVDVAFARHNWSAHRLPTYVNAAPAYLDALHLLVGSGHPLAQRNTEFLKTLFAADAVAVVAPGIRRLMSGVAAL